MERYQRVDPATEMQIRVDLFSPSTVGHLMDHYREVTLNFENGDSYFGLFFQDPQHGQSGRGAVFWDDPTMVLVPDLDTDTVLSAVDWILKHRAVSQAFEPLTEGNRHRDHKARVS